jgi:hypothetical protein
MRSESVTSASTLNSMPLLSADVALSTPVTPRSRPVTGSMNWKRMNCCTSFQSM